MAEGYGDQETICRIGVYQSSSGVNATTSSIIAVSASICGCLGPINCEFMAYGTGIIKIYEKDADFQDVLIL